MLSSYSDYAVWVVPEVVLPVSLSWIPAIGIITLGSGVLTDAAFLVIRKAANPRSTTAMPVAIKKNLLFMIKFVSWQWILGKGTGHRNGACQSWFS